MATLYYKGTSNSNFAWSTKTDGTHYDNWYTDALPLYSVHSEALPTTGDLAIMTDDGITTNMGAIFPEVDNAFDVTCYDTFTITGPATIIGTVRLYDISGLDDDSEGVYITGDIYAYDSSFGGGCVLTGNYFGHDTTVMYVSCSGNVELHGAAAYIGVCEGDGTFYDNSYMDSYGEIKGNAVLYGGSCNHGVIDGNATYYDYAANGGTVLGTEKTLIAIGPWTAGKGHVGPHRVYKNNIGPYLME